MKILADVKSPDPIQLNLNQLIYFIFCSVYVFPSVSMKIVRSVFLFHLFKWIVIFSNGKVLNLFNGLITLSKDVTKKDAQYGMIQMVLAILIRFVMNIINK